MVGEKIGKKNIQLGDYSDSPLTTEIDKHDDSLIAAYRPARKIGVAKVRKFGSPATPHAWTLLKIYSVSNCSKPEVC